MSIQDIYREMSYGPAPEGAELAVEWLDKHRRRFGHFIGGSFTAGLDAEVFVTFNPATGEPLASVTVGTASEVDSAVIAARVAFETWSVTPGRHRAAILYGIARLIDLASWSIGQFFG